jgi:hypothetical protein
MDLFRLNQLRSVAHAGLDILHCQVRVIALDDLGEGDTRLDKLEHTLDGNARALKNWLSKMDLRIDHDATRHHLLLSETFSIV